MISFFKNHYAKIGWIITILNLLAIINSTRFFLYDLEFPVPAWLFFNACAPSVLIFVIGFVFRNRAIMAASLPFLFFFGGLGLFTFSWSNGAVIAQIGHLLMVIALIYTVIIISMEKIWKKSAPGLIIGIVLFALVLPFQQKYVKGHPEYIKKLGDPAFEEMMKNK